MLKKFPILLLISLTAFAQRKVALGDWPEQRGPNRDGVSQEKNLPDKWSLQGENLLWRVPYGGRSAPVIMGNHLYVQNPAGRGAEEVSPASDIWPPRSRRFAGERSPPAYRRDCFR